MKKASTKDILRTIWKEKKRFFSIMMITILGVTLMTGLKAGCRDLRNSADKFYDAQNLFDISMSRSSSSNCASQFLPSVFACRKLST